MRGQTLRCDLHEAISPLTPSVHASSPVDIAGFCARTRAQLNRAKGPSEGMECVPRDLKRRLDGALSLAQPAVAMPELRRVRQCLTRSIHWDEPAALLPEPDREAVREFCAWAPPKLQQAWNRSVHFVGVAVDGQATLLGVLGAMKGMLPRASVRWMLNMKTRAHTALADQRLLALGRTIGHPSEWLELLQSYQQFQDHAHLKGHLLWALSRSLLQSGMRLKKLARVASKRW